MVTGIALFRGINVSGHKMIKMNVLKALFESLGLQNVRTYLQSGNVVFDCEEKSIEFLGKRIEEKVLHSLNLTVPVILRSGRQVEKILLNNPFLKGRNEDAGHLYVTFLSEEPSPANIEKLKEAKSDTSDEYILSGREIYLFCPGGYGNTKLSNNFFESKLKIMATTRNWRTVNRLHLMLGLTEKS